MKGTPLAWFVLALLLAINIYVYVAVFGESDAHARVSFLNVGQGDAILVESPSGVQVLIDGGPDRSVLRELGKELGFFDRSIDIVIATHPDKDHIAGLVDVFERYRITSYIESGVTSDSIYASALHDAVASEGLDTQYAKRGMRISLGEGMYIDILYPDRDVTHIETNTASVVARVVYGTTEFMLTGDAPSSVEEWVVALGGEVKSDVLKVGHHGSRTSTSELWLAAVQPAYAVVSAGKDNSYGHPHQEVTQTVQAAGAELLSIADEGTIRFETDGASVWVKEKTPLGVFLK